MPSTCDRLLTRSPTQSFIDLCSIPLPYITRALLRLEKTTNLIQGREGGRGGGGEGGEGGIGGEGGGEGGRDGGRGGREGGRVGGREGGREEGVEGGRDDCYTYSNRYVK